MLGPDPPRSQNELLCPEDRGGFVLGYPGSLVLPSGVVT
jgi:hypothetical protein